MNEELQKNFTPKPMISYKRSRKISSYLVLISAKLCPINRTVGCYNCDSKRCEVCKFITETDTFASTFTGETSKITTVFTLIGRSLFCTIWQISSRAISVKNNTVVKLQTTFVVDGTNTNLEIEVLIEENDLCKNICTNILKVKVIQVSVTAFL